MSLTYRERDIGTISSTSEVDGITSEQACPIADLSSLVSLFMRGESCVPYPHAQDAEGRDKRSC